MKIVLSDTSPQSMLQWAQIDSGAMYAACQPALAASLVYVNFDDMMHALNQLAAWAGQACMVREIVTGAGGKVLPLSEEFFYAIKKRPILIKRGLRALSHLKQMQYAHVNGHDLTGQLAWTIGCASPLVCVCVNGFLVGLSALPGTISRLTTRTSTRRTTCECSNL